MVKNDLDEFDDITKLILVNAGIEVLKSNLYNTFLKLPEEKQKLFLEKLKEIKNNSLSSL